MYIPLTPIPKEDTLPRWRFCWLGNWQRVAVCLFVTCLTCKCISGTGLHRQLYVLPHWDRSCRSNFLPHSALTPRRPVPALTLKCQAPGRVATGVPMFKSLVWLDPEKSRRKRDSNPGSSAPEADAVTTRPTRRSRRWQTKLLDTWKVTQIHGR